MVKFLTFNFKKYLDHTIHLDLNNNYWWSSTFLRITSFIETPTIWSKYSIHTWSYLRFFMINSCRLSSVCNLYTNTLDMIPVEIFKIMQWILNVTGNLYGSTVDQFNSKKYFDWFEHLTVKFMCIIVNEWTR